MKFKALMIALFVGMMAGCASYQDISGVIGSWTREKGEGDFELLNIRQDGRFSWHHTDVATHTSDDLSGTWAREGDRLVLTEAVRNGKPIPHIMVEFRLDSLEHPSKLTTANGFELRKYSRK